MQSKNFESTSQQKQAYSEYKHSLTFRVGRYKPNSITVAGSKLVADLQRAEIWPII